MQINFDLHCQHHIVAASSHTYLEQTQELEIDRTLAHHDIIYLVEGEWPFIETVDGKEVEYLLKPHDILIFSAGNHKFVRKPCKSGTKTYCIHITKEGHDLETNFPNCLTIDSHFSCERNPSIITYFKQACDAFWSDENYSQIRADAFLSLLLTELGNINKEVVLSREVKNAIKVIENSLDEEYNSQSLQNEILQSSGLSYKKLSNLFKKETGKTIHSYLISKKLEKVAEALELYPDAKLKEIAAKFYFYDEFYLSKTFKKQYGISPAEYRERLKYKKHKYDTIC